MRLSLRRGVAAMLLAIVITTPTSAQTTFELLPTSDYTFGCFPPCLCPIFFVGVIEGDFVSTPNGFDGTFDEYLLTDILWTGGALNSTIITGTGVFRVTPNAPYEQQLTLDLDIDGEAHILDSGVVGATAGYPTIDVAASENGFFCFDYAITLVAEALVPPSFVRGDCNDDGSNNIADAVFLLGALFPATTPPDVHCSDACDGNDDGQMNIADAIALLGAIFGVPSVPLPPPNSCDADPTPLDGLACNQFTACP